MKIFVKTSSLILALLLLAAGFSPAASVTVTDNGNGTVTMANGLVSMTFSKSDGSVSSFTTSNNPSLNLIDSSQDYALSLTHIGSGTNDYWVSIDSPGNPTYTVVTNNGQIADVMLENPIASGNASLYPNGLWDWVEHHVTVSYTHLTISPASSAARANLFRQVPAR